MIASKPQLMHNTSIPQWFSNKMPYCSPEEVYTKWNEYLGWKEDGYANSFIMVQLGLDDPSHGDE